MRFLRVSLFLVMIPLAFSRFLYSFDLSGSLRTSYYGLERLLPAGNEERNNLFYQSVSLRARGLGVKNLTLVTNLRFRGDASGNLENGDTHIYSLYAELNDILPGHAGMRVGRQFLYEGVGTGHLDGARAEVELLPRISLTGWAGTQVRYGAETTVASWNEASLWGGRLLVDVGKGTTAGLSYMRRMRSGSLERKILGGDASSSALGWAELYVKVAMDIELEQLRDAVIRATSKIEGPFGLDLEYSRRAPRIASSSFFNIIEAGKYDEVRLLPSYRAARGVMLSGEYGFVKYEGESTHRLRGGVSWQGFSGGLHFRQGYAGGRFGAYGSLRKDLPHDVEAYVSLDYARFALEDGESLESESFMAILSVAKRLREGARFVVDVQEGVNPAFDSDFRVLTRLEYNFRVRR